MNGGVVFLARSQARRRWRTLVALTIFVGIAGGLAISLVAGSRRSSTVVDRFFGERRQYDVTVYDQSSVTSERDIRALPGVVRADPFSYLAMNASDSGDSPTGFVNGGAVDFSAQDPTVRIIEGAVPSGSDTLEVVVNQAFVQQFGRSVGDAVDVHMFGLDQGEQVGNGVYTPNGPRYRFHIAAVARFPEDITLDEVHALGTSTHLVPSEMLVSNDFYEAHRDEFLQFGAAYNVLLEHGQHDRPLLTEGLRGLNHTGEEPLRTFPFEDATRKGSLSTPVQLETTSLLALGIGIALATAIALALILRAEQRSHENDTPTLRALGCSANQVGAVATLRVVPAALVGALVAVGIALALSAQYPIKIGRQLELQRGIDADVPVLAIGALVIAALVLGSSFLFGRPRRARDVAPPTRATFSSWLGRVGAPTDLALGAYLAFARTRRARSVPSRPAIVAGAAALAVVSALGVYVAGVDHLYSVPEAHGWRWDAAVGNVNFPLAHATSKRLAADPNLRQQTPVRYGQASVNGQSAEFLAFDDTGDAPPGTVAGRLPRSKHEIALGSGLLDDLGTHLGSTVRFSVKGGEFDSGARSTPQKMKIVGQALAPVFGESDVVDVGIVTLDGVKAAGGNDRPQIVLTRVQSGNRDTRFAALDRKYTEEIATDVIPSQIVNLHRVRVLPLLGAAVAGLMGIFVILYAMAVSARARTRDLAVFRAVGLPGRRLRRILAWEGTVLAVTMTLVGIPIGLLVGAALWGRVTDQLGVHGGAVVAPLILLLAPFAVLVAVGAALYPARRARRVEVAALLRAE